MLRTLLCTAAVCSALGSLRAQSDADPDARQILWQRTLDDAVAIATAEHRPLLIALNMDGESASDRIVKENYRDPAFVAATRACVCVVGSVFRHAPRDYDGEGRRIPCPRLGEVTCGEHIALEPLLFDRYLSDGERVAPRHALVLPDGSKAFDVFLCFDLHDIDRALFEAVAPFRAAAPAPEVTAADWAALAARRDARGRAALEAALARAGDPVTLTTAWRALAQHGDAGAADALCLGAAALPRLPPELRAQWLTAVQAVRAEAKVIEALRVHLQAPGALPADVAPGGREIALPFLALLDGANPATRSLLLACRALAAYGDAATVAVKTACDEEACAAIEASVRAHGGPFDLHRLLLAARLAPHAAATEGAGDAMPDSAALEQTLEELDRELAQRRGDPAFLARYAKTSLDLGRRRLEAQAKGAQVLLEDAAVQFGRALELDPAHGDWWVERARTAYYLQRWAEESEYGRRALAIARGADVGLPHEAALAAAGLGLAPVVEALRWIGDGEARLLAERSGGDPAVEIAGILDGLRALGAVCASPHATAKDWIALVSFCGALGLRCEELACAYVGALRAPAASELRQALHDALWNAGRLDLAPAAAASIELETGPSAESAWFRGYAEMLAAEEARRTEQPQAALPHYEAAASHFARAAALRPDIENAPYYSALTWIGRGLAQARLERRAAAADCLVAAAALHVPLAEARDGLGCDVFDLVDRTLEWRDDGPSAIAPVALLDRIEPVAPDDPLWPLAIADAALREALRADGRNPERAMRRTVDAKGEPIEVLLGLPCAEGDALLAAAVQCARRAQRHAGADLTTLAQCDTIWAERMLERGRLDGVREALAEAAPILGFPAPAEDADADALRAAAAQLRAELGEAAPRARAGR
jgi:hypothetical protein